MLIDLTRALSPDMPVYPGLHPPSLTDIARVESDGYAMSEWLLINHVGTHVDAPSHQILGGESLDAVPLDRLVTGAAVLDFTGHVPGEIGASELRPFLPGIRPGDYVLIHSGNGANWGSDRYWDGFCYPGKEAIAACLEIGVAGLGVDGPSADPVDTTTFELHRLWLGAGCLLLENLANLDQLPPRVRLIVAPLKVAGANGAPARVYADTEV